LNAGPCPGGVLDRGVVKLVREDANDFDAVDQLRGGEKLGVPVA
jgi:hypothetical protein